MAKKVFAMYLAKEGNPNSDAYAKLDLPASPWELWDALDKVRLQKEDILLAVQLCLDTRKLHILKDGGSHDT